MMSLFIQSGEALTLDPSITISVGNENYTFATQMEFSSVNYNEAPSWICFNTTGFNISSPNPINITLIKIHSNMLTALDGATLVKFKANATLGTTVYFNITGFIASQKCALYKDNVFFSYLTIDSGGRVNFSHSSWSEHTFEIRAGSIANFTYAPAYPTNEDTVIFHDTSIGYYITQKKWYINHTCVATNNSDDEFNYNQTFNLSDMFVVGLRMTNGVNVSWLNQTVQVDRNVSMNKSVAGAGLNYVCYHQQLATTAYALATSFGVSTGSWIHMYNKTKLGWDSYWVGHTGVNFPVRTWDVVIIVVGSNKTTRVNLSGDVTTNQSKSITAGYSYLTWSQWNESSSMQNMSSYGLIAGDWIFMYNTTARTWSSYWVGFVGDDTLITGYSCFVVNVAGARTIHLGD